MERDKGTQLLAFLLSFPDHRGRCFGKWCLSFSSKPLAFVARGFGGDGEAWSHQGQREFASEFSSMEACPQYIISHLKDPKIRAKNGSWCQEAEKAVAVLMFLVTVNEYHAAGRVTLFTFVRGLLWSSHTPVWQVRHPRPGPLWAPAPLH